MSMLNNLPALTLIISGVLSFLAVALSIAWQKIDTIASNDFGAKLAELERLRQQRTARPVEAQAAMEAERARLQAAEERAVRLRKLAAWVRAVGLLCLYGGVLAAGLGLLMLGINALERGA